MLPPAKPLLVAPAWLATCLLAPAEFQVGQVLLLLLLPRSAPVLVHRWKLLLPWLLEQGVLAFWQGEKGTFAVCACVQNHPYVTWKLKNV